MAKWIYTCETGTQLREAINEGDLPLVIRTLRSCIQEILLGIPHTKKNEDLVSDFDDLFCFLDGEEDLVRDQNFQDAYYDDPEELVDVRLHEFYDLCDEYRIFVAL